MDDYEDLRKAIALIRLSILNPKDKEALTKRARAHLRIWIERPDGDLGAQEQKPIGDAEADDEAS